MFIGRHRAFVWAGYAILAALMALVLLVAGQVGGRLVLSPVLLLAAFWSLHILFATIVGIWQLTSLLRDREVRVIHGLEHATVAVLRSRGMTVVEGLTEMGSFNIDIDPRRGKAVWPWDVKRAARQAIARVLAGEHDLVYSPRCGTSLWVSQVVTSLVVLAFVAVAFVRVQSLTAIGITVISCVAVGTALGRPLGLLAQKHLTVSPHFVSARITRMRKESLPHGRAVRYHFYLDIQLPEALPVARLVQRPKSGPQTRRGTPDYNWSEKPCVFSDIWHRNVTPSESWFEWACAAG